MSSTLKAKLDRLEKALGLLTGVEEPPAGPPDLDPELQAILPDLGEILDFYRAAHGLPAPATRLEYFAVLGQALADRPALKEKVGELLDRQIARNQDRERRPATSSR